MKRSSLRRRRPSRSSDSSGGISFNARVKRRAQLEKLEDRHLLAAVTGEVYFDTNADGLRQPAEIGVADVRVFIDQNANGRLDPISEMQTRTDAAGKYAFPSLVDGKYEVRIEPEPGLVQTAPVVSFGWDNRIAVSEDGQQFRAAQLFKINTDGEVETIGQPTSSRMDGLVRTSSGTLVGIDTRQNELFRIDPFNGERIRIAQTATDIDGGLAYDRVTNSVYTLVRGNNTTTRILAKIDINTAQTTLIGTGMSGLAKVGDIAFDSANRRIIGFDDSDNQFFAFDLFGNGRTLSFADRPIDSNSLAITDPSELADSLVDGTVPGNGSPGGLFGSTFVRMFDDNDDTGTGSFLVNVNNGQVVNLRPTETKLRPTGLTRSPLGNNARDVTLQPNQTLPNINFGITNDVIGFRITPLTPETGPGSLTQSGVTVVGGSIGEDFVEITLNRRPTSNVVLNVSLTNEFGVEPGALLDVNQLTFTPSDWNTPRRITITPDPDNPVRNTTASTLTVTVDVANSDVAWRTLPSQQIPVRTLPAQELLRSDRPVINEIFIDARFASGFTSQNDQYIELRGAPNSVLPAGSYFVVIDEYYGYGGRVNSVIDLSGQSFGSNGYLVMLQSGSTYDVNLAANTLRSTNAGFAGLPGGIFSGPANGVFYSIFNDASYFLIQSDVPPAPGDVVDNNSDGILDSNTPAAQWTTYDAVGTLNGVTSQNNSLAPIVFIQEYRNTEVRQGPNGQVQVLTRGNDYLGRIGDSIGSDYNDWVSGFIQNVGANFGGIETDTESRFEFDDENLSYPALFDRPLDHLGGPNFVGGVRGQINLIPSAADVLAGASPDIRLPAEGVTVFVDTNGNGRRDELTFNVEPNSVVPPFDFNNPGAFNRDYSMTNAFPGVAISSNLADGLIVRDNIVSARQTISGVATGNRIFSEGTTEWFDSNRRLRFDFHNPIQSASIAVVPRFTSTQFAYGRLDAYNAAGDLVASSISSAVGARGRGTISVAAPGANIVRVEAYGDDRVNFFSSLVGFDSFSYVQAEPAATTDQNGVYEISGLFPGQYELNVQETIETNNLVSTNLQPFVISRYDNYFFESEFKPNSVPTVRTSSDIVLQTSENPIVGTIIGNVPGFDADSAPLTYEFVGGDSTGLVLQNRADGSADIVVGSETNLDFEADPTRILTIRISDQVASTTARVTLDILDVNEAPVVSDSELSVTEDMVVTGNNTLVVGLIDAVDPDTGTSQGLQYSIIGGDGQSYFSVDPSTGVVSLIRTPDFETVEVLTLRVRVSDASGSVTEADKIVRIGDENDPPSIAVDAFVVDENQTGDLFKLIAVDPDVGQTHVFALTDPPIVDPNRPVSDAFGVRSDGTVFLQPGRTLDADAVAANSFWIVVSDNGSPSKVSRHRITVDLNNIDEQATIRLPSEGADPFEIREDATNFVGQIFLELQDPEGLDQDYAFDILPGPSSDLFAFDPLTGVLKVAAERALDFETRKTHDLTFEIFDRTGQLATTRQTITVNVLDVNEPGTILTDEIKVSEVPNAGDIIGRINVFDPEGDPMTIAIIGGTAAQYFEFAGPQDPFALRVKGDTDFDFEAPDPPGGRTLTVRLSQADANLPVVEKTITIRLNEVNEPPIFDVTAVPGLIDQAVIRPNSFSITIPESLAIDPDPLPVKPSDGSDELLRPKLAYRVGVKVFDQAGNAVLNERGRQELNLPSWLSFDAQTRTLTGDFSQGFSPIPELTIRALESGPLPLATDAVLAMPTVQPTNPVNRFDVNGDGAVTPIDALRIINFLNGSFSSVDTLQDLFDHVRFLDVSGPTNGLSQVTSIDALQVINEVNRIAASNASSEPISGQTQASSFAFVDDDGRDDRQGREDAIDAVIGEPNLF